jgi:hypothetical protein
MKLDAAQPEVMDTVQLVHRVGAVRKNRAKGDGVSAIDGGGEVIDVLLLTGIGGYVEHDRNIHTLLVHGAAQISHRAVGVGLKSAADKGELFYGAWRESVRETMRVEIDQHGRLLYCERYLIIPYFYLLFNATIQKCEKNMHPNGIFLDIFRFWY